MSNAPICVSRLYPALMHELSYVNEFNKCTHFVTLVACMRADETLKVLLDTLCDM